MHDSSANLGEVIGPLAIGLLLAFFDWRTTLQIWALPGLVIGVLYAVFGGEGEINTPRPRDYRRAVWNDVLRNPVIFALAAVSTLRAMGQTALAAFLPLYLSLHLQLSAGVAGAYMSVLFLFAGMAPAVVGWVSDRFGHKRLVVIFSLLSAVTIGAIPHLGSGFVLGAAMGALGALLWALRPVIVSAALKGLKVKAGPAPAAKATIIVSPIAREIATIKAAATPDSAAGKTTLTDASNLVAPRP